MAATGEDGTGAMDSEVWERLPDEIVPQILSCLPWWSNLRLRRVSRAWKTLLSDPKFLTHSTPSPAAGAPYCILRNSAPFTIGDLNTGRWNELKDFSSTWGNGFRISATSSGIFLMHKRDPNVNFLVNPLNRTQRMLPPLPKLEDQLVVAAWHYPMTMKVEENPVNVKVVGLQFSDGKLTRVYVYDLLRHSWDVVSDNVTGKNFRAVQSSLIVGDDIFLLTPSDQLFRVYRRQLVEIPLPDCSHEGLVIKHIFQHKGSLMLANGLWVSKPHPQVELWRFDGTHGSWQKIREMPERYAVELENSKDLFKVDAEGDVVGFGCFHSKVLVLHNLVTSEWWTMDQQDLACNFAGVQIMQTLWQQTKQFILGTP
ncbi:hypothetical protein R1sor_011954 [Riccia sorocarpa]|uniref:F-box domain-containing protein n=1 Tax=Riccia sorocarpa TaxID=122646 RepID=A0ABD3I2G3_9MARC